MPENKTRPTVEMDRYEFRNIRPDEVNQIMEIEQICFPPNEVCSLKTITDRIASVQELFLVAVCKETGKIAGFLDGIPTDEENFRDEFFTDISLCIPSGKRVMLLELDVLPEHRNRGLAREIVMRYCNREKAKGREVLHLICLEQKVEMYKRFGFIDLGMSNSSWGGETWHEMICNLQN